MLLGRLWFKSANLKQDWERNEVALKKGKNFVRIAAMTSKKKFPMSFKPMMAQTVDLAEKVEDDEEACFLEANPTIVLVFEVDVKQIIDKYVC